MPVLMEPVGEGRFVRPPPVSEIETMEFFAAGLSHPLTEPSWFSTAACPTPLESNENTPGEDSSTRKLRSWLVWPLYCTRTTAVDALAISHGTTALIWL